MKKTSVKWVFGGIVAVLVVMLIIMGFVFSKGHAHYSIHSVQNNQQQVLSDSQAGVPSEQPVPAGLKLYKNDDFSFLYNPNTTMVKETLLDSTSGKTFNVWVAPVGEKNTEMGVYIYEYTQGEPGFAQWCAKPTEIEGKSFCVNPTNGGGDFTDGADVYMSGTKELQLWISASDPNALSDDRYIVLGSLQIY